MLSTTILGPLVCRPSAGVESVTLMGLKIVTLHIKTLAMLHYFVTLAFAVIKARAALAIEFAPDIRLPISQDGSR